MHPTEREAHPEWVLSESSPPLLSWITRSRLLVREKNHLLMQPNRDDVKALFLTRWQSLKAFDMERRDLALIASIEPHVSCVALGDDLGAPPLLLQL